MTVHGDDDIHLAAAGETPWKAQIDLIDADELGLCSRKQNLGGLASGRCRDRLRTAEPDARAKQDEKDLVALGSQVDGRRDEAVLRRIKPGDLLEGPGAVGLDAQDERGGNPAPI